MLRFVVLNFSASALLICCLVNALGEPKRCKYEDSKCILYALNYYLQEKYMGDDTINLAQLDPIIVKEINIKKGNENSPIQLDLLITDSKNYGLKDSVFSRATGFGRDMTTKKVLHLKGPVNTLIGNYQMNGKFLLLPVKGHGSVNLTSVDTLLILTFNGESYEKNGVAHMRINNMKMLAKPKRQHMEFTNIFQNNPELTESMNMFLNENWQDVFREVEGPLSDAYSNIFQALVNPVLEKYPYADLFMD